MKIAINVKNINKTWEETYDIENGLNPDIWAQNTIDNFNATLRQGESPRELLGVRVIAEDSVVYSEHSWKKNNLVSISGRNGHYDILECERCGVTAKRYGFEYIVRDAAYKAKKYDKCTLTGVEV